METTSDTRRWLLLAAGGLALTGAGLVLDLVLHARDPDLAAQEGVFTVSNPGHLLTAVGLTLVAVGVVAGLVAGAGRARRFVTLGGAGVVALVVGTAAVATGAGGVGHSHAHDDSTEHAASHPHDDASEDDDDGTTAVHDHGASYDPVALRAAASPTERAAADELAAATRAALAPYADIDAALAAGYRTNVADAGVDLLERQPAGRTIHLHSAANRRDGETLDPERVEGLVYRKAVTGDWTLLGGVYTALPGEAVRDPGGPITAWHTHDDACPQPEDAGAACPTAFRMMHVWTHEAISDPFARHLNQLRASRPRTSP